MTNVLEVGVSTSQPQYRRSYNVLDDWGRRWLVTVETKTGELVGIAEPAGWEDPISTPPSYMKLDPRDPNRLLIDYAQWAQDLERAQAIWKERMEETGFDRFGEKYDPDEPPTPYLLRLVGPKPKPDPSVPLAALDGDPEALGCEPVASSRDLEAELGRLRAENERLRKLRAQAVAMEQPAVEGEEG